MADHVDAHTCCGDPTACERVACPDDGECWSCMSDPCVCLEPDPDPEPGSWEWELRHGCMDCGVCDDCIERTRAHFEEMSDAEVQVLGEGKP